MLMKAQQPQTAPTDRWLALVGAVERLSAADSMEAIIAVVRQTARAVSGADGVTFVLRDGEQCHYVDEDAVGPLWKGKRFPLSACISGWCMLNGEMAAIPDIYEDARIPHDAYRPTFVKSLVMTPVRTDDPLAAIGAYWGVCRDFTDTERALLEGLARSTAAAIASVQARERLKENEARLRLALDAGRLGAWELDLATDALTGSGLCRAHLGLGDGEALAFREVASHVHPDDLRRLQEVFRAARAMRSDFNVEFRTRSAAGAERWIELRGRVALEGDGEPRRMTGVSLDITEREQAKSRVEALQAELAQIGRLSELSQMSSAFAHELNQPLAAANNYLMSARRLLSAAEPDVAKALEAIGKAGAQYMRASQTVQRIRGFIGNRRASRTVENIASLTEEAAEIALVSSRHKKVDVMMAVEAGLPPVLVDKVQLQQVLLNLIRNALEAMESSAEKVVTVSAAAIDDGRMIEVKVEDTGPGLDEEVAAHLFEPFVTTKSDGMGVGLLICRQIVEAHGGRMWAGAAPGGGAAFCFTVPTAA
ncbi:MAG TPA: ATP-binding protein [Caulobacteraceae bacterium]|nr:ATP-binding protein [Caulobacteraceae bacterium]